MKITDRVKAALSAFRGKSAGEDAVTLNQLLQTLGVHDVDGGAQSEATYFACLKVLSEALGKLPLRVQQRIPGQGVRQAVEHPFYRMLFERPNRFMTASTFWSSMELCRNHFGNAYAWIDSRDPERTQLWPLDPRQVHVYYDNARKLADVPDVYYQYSTPQGVVTFGSEEVLHFKTHNTIDGLVGVSVREQLASTIMGNVKAQKMLNKMIDSGMTAKSVLTYTGDLNEANVKTLLKQIEKYAKGEMASVGVENIVPIPVGWSMNSLNVKLADSQFLELRQYSALQIASAFGVKPYQVGDYTKSSYSSAEAQQLSFLVDTLLFNVKHYEEEICYKLLNDSEEVDGYHAKFITGTLLRTDPKSQITRLRDAVSGWLMTPNEAREELDLPAVEGGDQLIGNGSTIPITEVGNQWKNTGQAPAQSEQDDPSEESTEEEPADHKKTSRRGRRKMND